MSTFTQFNAPGCVGPSGKDLIAYQTAFTNLLTELREHISTRTDNGADVHGVLSTLTEKLNEYIKLANLQSQVQTLTEDTINISTNGTNKLQTASAVERKIADYYTSHSSDDLAHYVPKDCASPKASSTDLLIAASELTEQLGNYLSKEIAESEYATKEAVTAEIDDTVNNTNWKTLLADVITANNYLKAKIQTVKTLDFIKWSAITASFVGTGGANSVYSSGLYVLGCVSLDWFDSTNSATLIATKSGRAYVKYVNTDSLDAVLDWAITKVGDEYTGAISAHVSKKADSWKNLRFHICVGTAGDDDSKTVSGTKIVTGTKIAYLCISADNLIGNTGANTNLQFFVAGENFIPKGEIGYAEPNGMATEVTSVYIGGTPSGTFAASSGQFNEILSSSYLDANGTVILKIVEREIAQEDGTTKKYNYLFIGGTDERKNYDQIVFATRPCLVDEKTDPDTGETTEALTYFVTADDVANMAVPIGVIFRWSVPDKIPEGFLKCDGSQISALDNPDYAEICELLGTNEQGYATLPEEYNSIIKYKYYSLYDKIAQPDYTQIIDFDILNKRLEHETSKREEADNQLATRVTTAEGKVATAEANVQQLGNKVTTAESNIANLESRANAASTLITGLDSRLGTAENAITSEADTRHDEDTRIRAALEEETRQRTKSDQSLSKRITDYEDMEDELKQLVRDEASNREAADLALSTRITGEFERADTAEKALSTRITGESERADAAEKALSTLVGTTRQNLEAFIGTPLTQLETEDKSSVVAAVNEVLGKARANTESIQQETTVRAEADSNLTRDIQNASAETKLAIGSLADLETDTNENIIAAINEVNAHVGNPSALTTEDKSSLVAAVNELDANVGDPSAIISGDTTSLVAGLNNESRRRQNADTEIKGSVTDLENADTEIKSDITSLDTRVTALENKE